jgi:hypothetical protein
MRKEGKRKQKPKQRAKPASPSLEALRNAEMLSVAQLSLIEPAFTPGALRWYLFNRETNGLQASGAVVEHGRRVLLRPKPFRAWYAGGAVKVGA